MGTALESLIPFAAGHEIIRQRRRDLTLIGPISDLLFDQLIGAGCVQKIIAAWVGNVSAGLGHNYRRACEQGIPQPVFRTRRKDYGVIFLIAPIALAFAFLFMLGVQRGERAESV